MLLLRHHGPNAAHAPKWPRTKSSEVVDRARDAVVSEGGVGESGEGGHWLRRPRGGPPAGSRRPASPTSPCAPRWRRTKPSDVAEGAHDAGVGEGGGGGRRRGRCRRVRESEPAGRAMGRVPSPEATGGAHDAADAPRVAHECHGRLRRLSPWRGGSRAPSRGGAGEPLAPWGSVGSTGLPVAFGLPFGLCFGFPSSNVAQ